MLSFLSCVGPGQSGSGPGFVLSSALSGFAVGWHHLYVFNQITAAIGGESQEESTVGVQCSFLVEGAEIAKLLG